MLNLRNHRYQCEGYDLFYGFKVSGDDHVSVISLYVWQQQLICAAPDKIVFEQADVMCILNMVCI